MLISLNPGTEFINGKILALSSLCFPVLPAVYYHESYSLNPKIIWWTVSSGDIFVFGAVNWSKARRTRSPVVPGRLAEIS